MSAIRTSRDSRTDRTDRTTGPCPSTFDRWRCQREAGHDGLHCAGGGGDTATWSDALSGRDLRALRGARQGR